MQKCLYIYILYYKIDNQLCHIDFRNVYDRDITSNFSVLFQY